MKKEILVYKITMVCLVFVLIVTTYLSPSGSTKEKADGGSSYVVLVDPNQPEIKPLYDEDEKISINTYAPEFQIENSPSLFS